MDEGSVVSDGETLTWTGATDGEGGKELGRTWAPGEIVENLYRIRSVIGTGGMGIIYKAVGVATGQPFIIKSLLPKRSGDQLSMKRFAREAEEWVRIGVHPNIVRAHTVHYIDYLPHVIAEFVDGHALDLYLRKEKPEFSKLLGLSAQICWGMAFAHDKGLIHRDLKSSNVLISREGIAKVTDFGLAKRALDETPDEARDGLSGETPSSHTQTLGLLGTPEYMAPEQWEGRVLKASDIYAFGVLLYEIFCRRHPYGLSSSDPQERIPLSREAHLRASPRDPMELNPSLPEALASLMLRCLEKEASQRPKDFREISFVFQNLYQTLTSGELPPEPAPEMLSRQEKFDQAFAFLRLNSACCLRGEYDKAEDLVDDALEILRELQDSYGLGRACLNKGILKSYQCEYDKARKWLEITVTHAQDAEDWEIVARAYNGLAVVRRLQGEYEEAIRLLQQSLEYAKMVNDRHHMAMCYLNMGVFKKYIADYDGAMEMYRESLKIREELHDQDGIAFNLNNMGLVYIEQGKLAEAEDVVMRGIEIRKALGAKWGLAHSYNSLGLLYRAKQQYAEAIGMFYKSISISESINQEAAIARSFFHLAQTLEDAGQVEEALVKYRQACEMSVKVKDVPLQSEVNHLLGKFLLSLDRPYEALAHLEKSAELYVKQKHPILAQVEKDLATAKEKARNQK